MLYLCERARYIERETTYSGLQEHGTIASFDGQHESYVRGLVCCAIAMNHIVRKTSG
jgi:hypothetical protein